jgi:hypothetical protein
MVRDASSRKAPIVDDTLYQFDTRGLLRCARIVADWLPVYIGKGAEIGSCFEISALGRSVHALRCWLRRWHYVVPGDPFPLTLTFWILVQQATGSKPEPSSSAPPATPATPAFNSEDVYLLPGKIEICQVHKLQALERVRSGRQLLHRFMVRGHWRYPPAGWKDRRMRWINSHCQGPDVAAVIERA